MEGRCSGRGDQEVEGGERGCRKVHFSRVAQGSTSSSHAPPVCSYQGLIRLQLS